MKYNISFVWIWKVISCSLATGKYMEEGYFVMWFDFEEIWEKYIDSYTVAFCITKLYEICKRVLLHFQKP